MVFQPASPGSVAAFLAIVVVVLVAFMAGVYRSFGNHPQRKRILSRTGFATLGWLCCVAAIVDSGDMRAMRFQGLPVFMATIFAVVLVAALSPFGRRLAAGIPVVALVAFQGFRLPLELVLHTWAQQGTIPETMTWTGQNWDIVSGIVALISAIWLSHWRPLAWIANVVGFVLLLNVIRVVILSSPLPFAWNVQPPLQLAFHLPYALIAPVCVGGALFGHIVLTRALLRNPTTA